MALNKARRGRMREDRGERGDVYDPRFVPATCRRVSTALDKDYRSTELRGASSDGDCLGRLGRAEGGRG
jgi:hypothetical protein